MRIELELDGVRHVAGVQRRAEHWVVTLDGREIAASMVDAGGRWSLLVVPPQAAAARQGVEAGLQARDGVRQGVEAGLQARDGARQGVEAGLQARESSTVPGVSRSYDVSVEAGSDGTRLVRIDGAPLTVSVADPRIFRRRTGGRVAGSGPATILAPMPGRVVKVLVQRGDEVAARQAVVVIEAMKMENELRAARAGVVTEVRVTQGASVEANAVLVVLE